MVNSTFSGSQSKVEGLPVTRVGRSFREGSLTEVLQNTNSLSGVNREFSFNDADFSRVRKMIYSVAGISLPNTKESMVYSRLSRRLRILGLLSFTEYLDRLERNASDSEWEHFTNSLTTNLTSFYREEHHFELLSQQLRALQGRGTIHIWCCASSTGEEPYTIAITAMETFGSTNPPVKILATDIDTEVLAKAKEGVYRVDQTDKIPSDILRRYFSRTGQESLGLVSVKPEVKQLISFRKLNLLSKKWDINPGIDVIFCRNVMIYFNKEDQHTILKQFVGLMNPGGLLYAGHSENFMFASDLFKLKGRTVYEVVEKHAYRSVLSRS